MVTTRSAPITDVFSEQLSNAECPANNGTRFPIAVRRGFSEILIEPTAAGRLHLVPKIDLAYFYDASRSSNKNRWLDLIGDPYKTLINRHVAGDTGKALNAMQTADFVYLGFLRPVSGVLIDMDASLVNAETSTLAGAYSQGNGFTTVTLTDGTDPAGGDVVTLGQDGAITFTVPSAWTAARLRDILGANDAPAVDRRLYWLRLSVSAALSAGVEIEKITPRAEIGAGTITTDSQSIIVKAAVEYSIPLAIGLPDWVGALEFIAQGAAATTAQVTWIRRN